MNVISFVVIFLSFLQHQSLDHSISDETFSTTKFILAPTAPFGICVPAKKQQDFSRISDFHQRAALAPPLHRITHPAPCRHRLGADLHRGRATLPPPPLHVGRQRHRPASATERHTARPVVRLISSPAPMGSPQFSGVVHPQFSCNFLSSQFCTLPASIHLVRTTRWCFTVCGNATFCGSFSTPRFFVWYARGRLRFRGTPVDA